MPATRREWLQATIAGAVGLLPLGCRRSPPTPATDVLGRWPGKVPMRIVNDRPPCLETPWRYFRDNFTPNEAFYVRWHLQAFPMSVDLSTWRLRIDGAVDRPLELSMDDLKRIGADEVNAVNQCSGNSRSLSSPRVPGAQWGNGAMGNARWGGVSLATLLRRAGVKADAVEVTFDGLDEGPLSSVPDFIKALPIDHALQKEVTVAYAMNDQPVPELNGFPARLVVPGYYATYWIKALHQITVVPRTFDGYWMAKAYKIPTTPNASETPEHLATQLVPINRMNTRSFFTMPDSFEAIAGKPCPLEGIAFDGGSGIRTVDISADGGATWSAAELGEDLGRFSFRRWRYAWTPANSGSHSLQVRATNRDGATQPSAAAWNRSGFMRNVIEELPVQVA